MRPTFNRLTRRLPPGARAAGVLAVAAGSAVAVLVSAAPAAAHVEVSGIDVTQGGYGVVTFRVPSESDTASTTALTVTLPADTPIIAVDTQPKAGWVATVVKKPLAKPVKDDDGNDVNEYISEIDWKVTDPKAAIPPGQFDMFNASVGPLPSAPSVSFPALQTYSDGTTVNWDEKSANGQAEPEHPAPVLELVATSAPQPAAATAASSDNASWPGYVGLGAGALALVLSVLALLRTRRKVDAGA